MRGALLALLLALAVLGCTDSSRHRATKACETLTDEALRSECIQGVFDAEVAR